MNVRPIERTVTRPILEVTTATPGGKQPDRARTMSSQRLNPNKCSDPFQSNVKKCKTSFSQSYVSGSLPCRLQTTASRYHLQWHAGAETGFSPELLVVCADGLTESDHPFVILAPMMFHELCLRSEGCVQLFADVIGTVTMHLRKALSEQQSFDRGLSALKVLLQHTGNAMLPMLPKLIPCLSRPFSDRKLHDTVAEALGLMEQACGPDATKLIKAKIPTY